MADIALLLAVPLIPMAITVAILRYRLFDIRLVVSRAVLVRAADRLVVAARTPAWSPSSTRCCAAPARRCSPPC